jgi:hypothetical protein
MKTKKVTFTLSRHQYHYRVFLGKKPILLSRKPVWVKRLVCFSDCDARIVIRTVPGSVLEQVTNKLLGESKEFIYQLSVPAGQKIECELKS